MARGVRAFGAKRYRSSAEALIRRVWADEAGVTCRRWNWRQGVRTRLERGTGRAYFLFEALPTLGDDELVGARGCSRLSCPTVAGRP